jgi:hypothetical protein
MCGLEVGPGVLVAPGERRDPGAVIEDLTRERARRPGVKRVSEHPVAVVPLAEVKLRLCAVDRHQHPVDRAREADARRQLHPALSDLCRLARPAEGLQGIGEVQVAAERRRVVLGLLRESQRGLELGQAAVALQIGQRHPEHHARRGFAPGRADSRRGRHRLLGRRERALEVTDDPELRSQRGEHHRSGVAGWLCGQQRGGALELEPGLGFASGIEHGRRARLHEQRAALGIGIGAELGERLVEHRE